MILCNYFEVEKEKIASRRKVEKRLRREGVGKPFSSLNLQDIERLKKTGEFDRIVTEIVALIRAANETSEATP